MLFVYLINLNSIAYDDCWTTRDFSSKYSCNWAPTTRPVLVYIKSKYFPKREELSFITVLAFPKASSSGLTCNIFSSKHLVGALKWKIKIKREKK